MTKTPHKWADVLRAIADGEEVQYWHSSIEGWLGMENCVFRDPINHADLQWRIAPKKQTVWVNVYHGGAVVENSYSSKQKADASARDFRIACVPLTFTEGDGL